ncbi:MAG: DUF4268 domain-containing protein [Gemmatimonadota bacterium]|uniref:DUF4268 domain-containing protein n=1 Tax=Candidatus Palauibacter scopulicola TaxID=3056741 RepID=UPI002387CFAB|nr:DUF4268 domain-containing protein [Candidatus Palauibacter scopulicola]MDE2662360.1 DUF4268 domain-containing protein [Candidatus Palauibacter scopulicola]
MPAMPLARLEAVDPRTFWKSEATDFTPWLAAEENLELLGDAIGLELQLEAQEKDVGPFRADLLCKSTVDDSWVLVENQLERTDHTHLGQLLTYAAGLQAVTIVWIAHRFTDEHRAALDWLNEVTGAPINFFGLEIELWKIGESPLAPKFNVVSKPNEWIKPPPPPPDPTPHQQLQQQFWEAFRNHVADEGAEFKTTKAHPQNWMSIAIGRVGFQLSAIASSWNSEDESWDTGELRAEFVANGRDAAGYHDRVHALREEIETQLGESLVWHNPEDTKSWKVYLQKTADISDRSAWPEQHEWLRTHLNGLHRVFRPIVRSL